MQGSLDPRAIVVAELADVVGHVLEVGRRYGMVREEHLATGNPRLRLATQVEHDLEQLARMDALVERARQVGRQRTREELDLFVPVHSAGLLSCLCHQPNEGTSPFSRTGFGTRTARSLTSSNCVSKTVNPRPRRASIMCES